MGKLVQVDTFTVSSAVASVTLTGIDSDDVYMVAFLGTRSSVANNFNFRITKSGTADSTANYDQAYKLLRSDTTFGNVGNANNTQQQIGYLGGDNATYENNGIIYLYNFNSSSEYSFYTFEITRSFPTAPTLAGDTGGGVHTVASASDGIQFYNTTGNLTAGTFTLYKVL